MQGKEYEKENLTKKLFRFIRSSNDKRNRMTLFASIALIFFCILSFYFISTNENYYSKTIAKAVYISENEATQIDDASGNAEQIKKQQITAVVMNGIHRGERIKLQNTTTFSKANDLDLKINDEVFVKIAEDSNKKIISAEIYGGSIDLKRDKYISYVIILFILLILLIGGVKGFNSLISVLVNIVIFYAIIGLFLQGFNLIFVASIASILFIIVSISIVSGINTKTISAIIGTMAATLISMLITVVVIKLTHANGIHFEEMEFLTHPPEQIFLIEILIGTLGAIMDIAITISSSIREIYDKNPDIERKLLINSGMEIGKDIMGTMSNTLVFAYISGSIPFILLWLKNGFPISEIINVNISLEVIRALTGSIGIVISIPVTLYVSVLLLKNRKTGEV